MLEQEPGSLGALAPPFVARATSGLAHRALPSACPPRRVRLWTGAAVCCFFAPVQRARRTRGPRPREFQAHAMESCRWNHRRAHLYCPLLSLHFAAAHRHPSRRWHPSVDGGWHCVERECERQALSTREHCRHRLYRQHRVSFVMCLAKGGSAGNWRIGDRRGDVVGGTDGRVMESSRVRHTMIN